MGWFENFMRFFNDFISPVLYRNTFLISLYSILWGFPVPIIFALLLNELRAVKFKRVVQTCSYLPHFISLVVVCSMIKQFSITNGLFTDIIVFFGGGVHRFYRIRLNFVLCMLLLVSGKNLAGIQLYI